MEIVKVSSLLIILPIIGRCAGHAIFACGTPIRRVVPQRLLAVTWGAFVWLYWPGRGDNPSHRPNFLRGIAILGASNLLNAAI